MTDLPLLTPLSVETLRAQGVPAPFAIGQADRVRFSELDALDHVNNAVYLGWFETFRIAYLRTLGLGDYADARTRPALVLRQVGVQYHAPLHLDDTYVVTGRTRAYRRTSWTMEYRVYSGGSQCCWDSEIVKKLLNTPIFSFVMCIAFILLFFVLPKIFSGLVNPVVLMVACTFGFLYFGRKLVHNDNWR